MDILKMKLCMTGILWLAIGLLLNVSELTSAGLVLFGLWVCLIGVKNDN